MNKVIFFSVTILMLATFCKKKNDPNPKNPDDGNGLYELVCEPETWYHSKTGSDVITLQKGELSITSQHKKTEGSQYYTTVNPTCRLKGDFSIRLSSPYIKTSDTLNKGGAFVALSEITSFINSQSSSKTSGLSISGLLVAAGTNFPTSYKIVNKPPVSPEFYFIRTGEQLISKIKFDGDSVVTTDETFGTKDLMLHIGAISDSAGAKASVIKISKIEISSANSEFRSTDFNSATFKTQKALF